MTASSERPPSGRRRSPVGTGEDRGSAIIEFVFVAIGIMVPLLYLVVAVASVQQGRLSVTNAARDVGRATAISLRTGTAGTGLTDGGGVSAALRIALAQHGLRPEDVEVRYVAVHAECSSSPVVPSAESGSAFTVCVTAHRQLPAVPTAIPGGTITLVGKYNVLLDDFTVPKD